MQTDPFIDEIYEAAVVPEKWRAILDRLAEMADAEGALLFAACPGVPRWISSEAIQHTIEEWIGSKWYLDNPRGRRLIPLEEPRFLTDLDAMTVEEINASDFYTELLRPRGLGWDVRNVAAVSPATPWCFRSRRPTPRAGAPHGRRAARQPAAASRPRRAAGTPGLDRAKSTYHAGSDRPSSRGAHTGRSRGFGQCGFRQRAAHPDRRGQPGPAGVRPAQALRWKRCRTRR